MVTKTGVKARIVESTAKTVDIGSSYGFRAYNYVKTVIRIDPNSLEEIVYLNTRYGSILVDK